MTSDNFDQTEGANRRTLLGAATLGALLAAASGGAAAAADGWTAQEKANVDLVNAFFKSNAKDLDETVSFMTDDCAYRMTEAFPPAVGHEAIIQRLKPLVEAADSINFQVLKTFAAGPIVINHRIDTFESKTRPLKFEGVGVFFIKDGKIKEWTDYTITSA